MLQIMAGFLSIVSPPFSAYKIGSNLAFKQLNTISMNTERRPHKINFNVIEPALLLVKLDKQRNRLIGLVMSDTHIHIWPNT